MKRMPLANISHIWIWIRFKDDRYMDNKGNIYTRSYSYVDAFDIKDICVSEETWYRVRKNSLVHCKRYTL